MLHFSKYRQLKKYNFYSKNPEGKPFTDSIVGEAPGLLVRLPGFQS